MNPVVRRVQPLTQHRLLLDFANGEQKVFDLAPYLTQGVFRELRDISRFAAARVVAGSVEWPGAIDLSYDTLYLGSVPSEPAPEASRVSA